MNPDNLKETIKEATGIEIKTDKEKMIEEFKRAIKTFKENGLNDEDIKMIYLYHFKESNLVSEVMSLIFISWIDKILNNEL